MKFSELKLNPVLVKALEQQQLIEPTQIQEKCIPLIHEGKDVVGQSGTGSGKTLAFGLPLLEKIQPRAGIQALIITPTRELCVQVATVLQDFAKPMHLNVVQVYGGVSLEPQAQGLRRSEIVVGTPGRILDHLNRRNMDFTPLKYLVLDEADKMFEMGFQEDVEEIMRYLPKTRQTLLFSATISEPVYQVMQRHLRQPVTIKTNIYVDKSLLHQGYYNVPIRDKFSLLAHLIKHKTTGLSIVFCATRDEVSIVAYNLKKNGIDAMAIHGGLTQNRRLNALEALKNQNISVLVATDVAARGLDIKNVTHVYNYDVPKTSEEYIHRIGRTARAGAEGDAVTLLADRDHDNFRRVLHDRTLKIEELEIPSFEKVMFVRRSDEQEERSHGRGFGHSGPRNGGHGGGGFRSSAPRSGGGYRSRSLDRTSGYQGRSEGGGSSESRSERGSGGYGSSSSSGRRPSNPRGGYSGRR